MVIEFESKSLKELYCTGKTQDKLYKGLQTTIIKRYVKVVEKLKLTERIEDLYCIKSLHYEKKKGNLNGIEAVWINKKYRLLFKSRISEDNIINTLSIKKISKHYE